MYPISQWHSRTFSRRSPRRRGGVVSPGQTLTVHVPASSTPRTRCRTTSGSTRRHTRTMCASGRLYESPKCDLEFGRVLTCRCRTPEATCSWHRTTSCCMGPLLVGFPIPSYYVSLGSNCSRSCSLRRGSKGDRPQLILRRQLDTPTMVGRRQRKDPKECTSRRQERLIDTLRQSAVKSPDMS